MIFALAQAAGQSEQGAAPAPPTVVVTGPDWWLYIVAACVAVLFLTLLWVRAYLFGAMTPRAVDGRKSKAASKVRASPWEMSGRRLRAPESGPTTPHEPGSDDIHEYDDDASDDNSEPPRDDDGFRDGDDDSNDGRGGRGGPQ